MPAFARARAGIVFQRNKGRTVDHDNVELAILDITVIGATYSETLARRSEANPILRSRCARSIAQRLKCTAGKGDDIAFVIDGVFAPSPNCRKLSGQGRLQAAQDIYRAGQLRELELNRADLF